MSASQVWGSIAQGAEVGNPQASTELNRGLPVPRNKAAACLRPPLLILKCLATQCRLTAEEAAAQRRKAPAMQRPPSKKLFDAETITNAKALLRGQGARATNQQTRQSSLRVTHLVARAGRPCDCNTSRLALLFRFPLPSRVCTQCVLCCAGLVFERKTTSQKPHFSPERGGGHYGQRGRRQCTVRFLQPTHTASQHGHFSF
ncbi:hypothetical protein TraAM80_10295 [Trypanosoma rangeli]|uniref:Uncharacterized protein n=1 Tax=Trypanosoma rangeli TaxID=5698 RepID=A0A3R7LDT7_TRYRA|nr:uncharacterized protein TraAM80_10295 [Trypanosoma rangeli]RNE95279.1 hypothetical protein TraAM80_10295 [Trypanosoma rangeli]|eukprot:RNE95279.1 hypothetical protein TraAM80_10295 [Trypanosoma rangeli]